MSGMVSGVPPMAYRSWVAVVQRLGGCSMASKTQRRSPRHVVAVVLTLAIAVASVGTGEARGLAAVGRRGPARGSAPTAASAAAFPFAGSPIDDSLFGHSGKLRARFVGDDHASFAIPIVERLFGDSALSRPGVYAVSDSAVAVEADIAPEFSFISLLPFSSKSGGWLGGYHIGFWPQERGRALSSDAYANPDGFIVVTPENQDTRVSEHFRLRDFLTHDQQDVWPKYLVLHEDLLDKLELVIATLERDGHPVEHMAVMSGFRTPQYNANGGETGGRAGLSRHMYGDAADVFVDNNDDGKMDDLNHDHRVDYRDARVIQQAVEQVERQYPDLVGGVGVYRATHSHGPFAHVDVRGWRARWGRIG